MTTESPAIEARNLSRRFGDVVAVDAVDFDVRPGEVFGFLDSFDLAFSPRSLFSSSISFSSSLIRASRWRSCSYSSAIVMPETYAIPAFHNRSVFKIDRYPRS